MTLDAPQVFYLFEAGNEREIGIVIEAVRRIDLKVTVYGPNNSLVAENDDYTDRDPQIPQLPVEQGGRYIIVVAPSSPYPGGIDVGEFDIILSSPNALPPGGAGADV